MFDFVSTRIDADPESRRSAQLLAALIAASVRNAATRPTKEEAEAQRNINEDALAAIEYLFSPTSPADDHLDMIGGSLATMRAALLSDRELIGREFTPGMRRIIQVRYRWWLSPGTSESEPKEEETT